MGTNVISRLNQDWSIERKGDDPSIIMHWNVFEHSRSYENVSEWTRNGSKCNFQIRPRLVHWGEGGWWGTRPPQFPLTQLPPTLRQMAARHSHFPKPTETIKKATNPDKNNIKKGNKQNRMQFIFWCLWPVPSIQMEKAFCESGGFSSRQVQRFPFRPGLRFCIQNPTPFWLII